ncbi:MAG: Extracellular ligand-binding receptor [Candidatus Wolfebacteria bacterium GW2011_GWB2_46_69]|nr:MAG: Extracellular ligand-binding receptor [Candidatus Wolfebacteria bacterium GW2011_GWB2_46_69]KKU59730.1 MAG: Extracellular ligand-binding receptor [Candidatus Wolfebacteria bacterium GW2011_GWE2_47_12]
MQVVYEDVPDLAPKAAVSGAQKLMTVDKVQMILDMPYTGLASIQGMAEQNKVPVLDVIDSSDEIASLGNWIFSSGVYANGVGQEVAKFTKTDLKKTKAALLVGKDEYLMAVAAGFEKEFQAGGGMIVAREEFQVGDTDFKTQLAKIKNSGAETIFIAHLGEGGVVVKQANEIGFKGEFLGSDTFSLADVATVAGKVLDGRTYFGLWKNFDSTTPQQQAFADAYKAKYGKAAGDYLFYNVLGYDGMMVAAEALKNANAGSGEDIQKALGKISNYAGLSGSITLDSTGINRDPKTAIVTYKDGQIVRYAK